MKTSFYIFTVLLISIIMSSCSGSKSERNRKAKEMGEKDAIEFIEIYHDKSTKDIARIEFIINVRNKEAKLIQAGFNDGADKYIGAFKTTLETRDSILYKQIFEEQEDEE